jgi:Tfp pilus assembly protein PilZ
MDWIDAGLVRCEYCQPQDEEKMIDRRASKRKTCVLGVDCVDQEDHFPALMTSLSTGGAFIETEARLPPGHEMKLTIPYTGEDRYLIISGRVVRLGHNGLGIEFFRRASMVN